MITRNPKNILVADDSVFFRTKLSDILVEAGHRVRFARDGIDVINELKSDPEGIDLLILDTQMPNIDGFGVLEWMDKNGYRGRFPVLAVTGVCELTHVLNRLKELGASGLITKGFTAEQILYRVNQLLFQDKAVERIERRVPVTLPVDFSIGERRYTGLILNISPAGIFLHTREELLKGALLTLRFSLPGTERVFEVKGTVKWSTGPGSEMTFFGGYGIIFLNLAAEERELIREFVKTESGKIKKQSGDE